MADRHAAFDVLHREVARCTRCPRLAGYVGAVAPRRSYASHTYWNRPVSGFGDPGASLWVIGLAPGAHGANRTGRVFTGDRSGDFLYAALHRAGYASQPISTSVDDGLVLRGCYISGAARCAPPGNRPTPVEVGNCSLFLDREWDLLDRRRVILALGAIAWSAAVELANRHGCPIGRPPFGHAAEVDLGEGATLVGSYHVSQQNTFTGRLTTAMFDAVLGRARVLSEVPLWPEGEEGRRQTDSPEPTMGICPLS
jgi:uracil-DNA glycosylase family 4